MARQPRQIMRQGVGDLPTRAAVKAYVGPRGEPIFDGETLRLQDGVTPGGIPLLSRRIPSASGDPSADDIPQGEWTVWTNTVSGVTSVWANLAGTPFDMLNKPAF